MKALMDTCIIIDALQNRHPFCEEAQKIFLLCANDEFEGFRIHKLPIAQILQRNVRSLLFNASTTA